MWVSIPLSDVSEGVKDDEGGLPSRCVSKSINGFQEYLQDIIDRF